MMKRKRFFMAALPAFDAHAYVKRLKAAGFNEAQAEAQAELQSDILSTLVTEKLATKEDIKELSEINQELIRIMGKFNQLNWMIGFLLTGTVTILFKLFLHG
jgi:hypothetical protein